MMLYIFKNSILQLNKAINLWQINVAAYDC